MDNHEREFFISSMRSGKVIVKEKNLRLIVVPLTIDQSLEADMVFKECFDSTYADEIMTEYEIEVWMNESGLWTIVEENKTKSLKDDLEKLKIQIYNNRHEKKLREQIRRYIRVAEKALASHVKEKSSYFQNTREGYALSEKVAWIIKNTTYQGNKLYDFEELSLNYVIDEWYKSILSESCIRELAREEPWKSLWSIKNNSGTKLFANKENEELSTNQKNIIIWSQIYDNIQESLDCPVPEVIKDDDLLDGWFLVQSKKRESERLERELDSEIKNEKIKNSSEVFVMTNDPDNVRRIENMNNPLVQNMKKQRFDFIQKKKEVQHHELPDQQLEIEMQLTNMRGPNFRGGK
jgi:hypothetical protein